MTMQDLIRERLTEGLRPDDLTIADESHMHAGHSGSRPGGETHFRVDIVASSFAGKGRVERHRVVNALLADAFARGLHALALRARAPGE